MSSTIEFDLKGFDAVIERMKRLPVEVRGKAGRSALGSAARVVTNAAKANAARLDDPLTSERIASNITQRVSSSYQRKTGDLKIRVGVLGGARDYSAYGEISTGRSASENPGGDTFYWRFLEFGTEKMSARPFMRPALESSADQVVSTFADKLGKQLDKVAK